MCIRDRFVSGQPVAHKAFGFQTAQGSVWSARPARPGQSEWMGRSGPGDMRNCPTIVPKIVPHHPSELLLLHVSKGHHALNMWGVSPHRGCFVGSSAE
eukprot:11388384-Alexandrium_andersonii.AAC.1